MGHVSIWKEIVLSDWDDFESRVSNLTKVRYKWVFRGQSDAAWSPETSLFRAFQTARTIRSLGGSTSGFLKSEHEKLMIDRFKRNAHLYRSKLPESGELLEWLAIMQHYGAPTRLLDVTFSPYVAAYFVLEAGESSGAIYAFNHEELSKYAPENVGTTLFEDETSKHNFLALYWPCLATERSLAQQGAFLVPSTIETPLQELIEKIVPIDGSCIKMTIAAELRSEGLRKLREWNLTSTSLFPGIDGFCRSLRFQMLDPVKSQTRLMGRFKLHDNNRTS